MPDIIFGTENIKKKEDLYLCEVAWESGCRVFDTALAYGNQALLADFFSGIPDRSNYKIISKISEPMIAQYSVEGCMEQIFDDLKLNYLDALLIHAPKNVDHKCVLSAMQSLKEQGAIGKIGVSNYTVRHLKNLHSMDIVPDVLQNEIHPYLQEDDLVSYCQLHEIEVMAHSAFANGAIFKDKQLIKLAEEVNLPLSCMVLHWALQRGVCPIFSSLSPQNIRDNISSVRQNLPDTILKRIKHAEKNLRICNNPSWAEFD